MSKKQPMYQPVEGKTYSLFGKSLSTNEYYETIRSLADQILKANELKSVLETIQKYSSRKAYLKRILSSGKNSSLIAYCLNTIDAYLKQYTLNTERHLQNLPWSKIWDRRLATTREQYHLYMLEIELTNRLNRIPFSEADRKISLQPYCLQDFSAHCKAADTGFDYQCKFCSISCYQHHASRILKEHNIEPYIWMGASISRLGREIKQSRQTLGILGIACIPELIAGMRKCRKYKIPVVGIPLNANRCIRWFGEFHQNSVDLNELECLVGLRNSQGAT
jgi:hypothetical protein